MPSSPIREFTKRQAEIAHGILRNLSYEEIGHELGIEGSTVRQRVKEMALIFDTDSQIAFPPRTRIFVWTKQLEWRLERQPTVADILCASRESGQRFTDALHASVSRKRVTVGE